MSQKFSPEVIAAAKKAGVQPKEIVPMRKADTPLRDRAGLYLRLSAKTGDLVWSYWDGRQWGLYSNSKKNAMARRHKRSKKTLFWFGFHKKTDSARAR